MRRFRTNPLDNEPDEKLTFDDITTLAFAGIVTFGLAFLLWLGLLCATHRLERIL